MNKPNNQAESENIWGRGNLAEIKAHTQAQKEKTFIGLGSVQYVLTWIDPARMAEFHEAGWWDADIYHALMMPDIDAIKAMEVGDIKKFENLTVIRVQN